MDVQPLLDAGFPLVAVLDCRALPAGISRYFDRAGIDLAAWPRLLLVGNAGARFWEAYAAFGARTADPVDHYSRSVVGAFMARTAPRARLRWLYPLEEIVVPLQQLGALAGWSHPSPLGLGIHSEYGLWFAYRAALLTDAPLPLRAAPPAAPPCAACAGRPCLSACPAGAAGWETPFDVPACSAHRLAPGSGCADRCLARLACPVGRDQRYPEAQLRYHYLSSLETLRRWAA